MSLIHDSLRKLENDKNTVKGASSNSKQDGYVINSHFDSKKLWTLTIIVLGLILIIYAYLMLGKYQKQNEILLNDMKQLISNNTPVKLNTPTINNYPDDKLIVQPPITLIKKVENQPNMVSDKKNERQLKVPSNTNNVKINTNYLSVEKLLAPVNSVQKPAPTKTQKKEYKKKNNNRLTIKQTRQLVNNLQIQIEGNNTEEVTKLLKKLSLSSGVNSLVYLRMNAYWSTKTNDNETASLMYKKIIFQKPQDVQANTNLAILEARNNKVTQAISRLKALKLKYPTNKNVANYLNRIENMHVN